MAESRIEREQKQPKKDLLRVTFVFSEEDWNALGFSSKPESSELKKRVYQLIHQSDSSPDTLPAVMGTATVASFFNVNQQTVKVWAQGGELPAVKIHGRWRFTRDDVLNLMNERKAKEEQKKRLKEKEDERNELEQELQKIRATRPQNR